MNHIVGQHQGRTRIQFSDITEKPAKISDSQWADFLKQRGEEGGRPRGSATVASGSIDEMKGAAVLYFLRCSIAFEQIERIKKWSDNLNTPQHGN